MNLILIKDVIIGVSIVLGLYWFPYLVKKGWEDGRNASTKTARLCDVCFRDIKKWNDRLKKTKKL